MPPFLVYMAKASDYGVTTRTDQQAQQAEQQLATILRQGEDRSRFIIKHCAENIPSDRYVHPKQMDVVVVDGKLMVRYKRAGTVEQLKLHKHALGQLCDIASVAQEHKKRLNVESVQDVDPSYPSSWKRQLLADTINAMFKYQPLYNKRKQEAHFLHRIVNGELRGVLSQSYNRHLVSAAMLRPFVEVGNETGLLPAYAHATDMRVQLQMYLPYVFEPVQGEFIAFGACWGNSDFGQGRLSVSTSILRLRLGTSMVTEDTFSRVHVGAVVQDTDLRLDDEVAAKEVDAAAAAIKSAVREVMQPEQVRKLLDAVSQAAAENIPWDKLKTSLARYLTKEELGTVESLLNQPIEDLPPPGVGAAGPLPTKWWAASAVSFLADRALDPAKSMELRAVAGSFLNPAPR